MIRQISNKLSHIKGCKTSSYSAVCSIFDKGYRYGFNGQEKDNEINVNGGDYDFGARIYDGRLGRWLSLDPHQNKYPEFSPFKSMNNCPIAYNDPNGMDEFLRIILIDKEGSSISMQTDKKISRQIMTDGVKHRIYTGSSGSYDENHYYDFARVLTITQKSDGSYAVSESIDIFSDGLVRDFDGVYFGGDACGEHKFNVEDLEGNGGKQNSGFHLIGEGGGVSSTKQIASVKGDEVKTLDITTFLAVVGVVGKIPNQIPNIYESLGTASFLDCLKGMKESYNSLVEEQVAAKLAAQPATAQNQVVATIGGETKGNYSIGGVDSTFNNSKDVKTYKEKNPNKKVVIKKKS